KKRNLSELIKEIPQETSLLRFIRRRARFRWNRHRLSGQHLWNWFLTSILRTHSQTREDGREIEGIYHAKHNYLVDMPRRITPLIVGQRSGSREITWVAQLIGDLSADCRRLSK